MIKLNLIPPDKKEEIIKKHQLKKVFFVETILTIIIVSLFVTLLSFKYVLSINLASLATSQREDKQAIQYNKIKKYDQQFNQINTQIFQVAKLEKDQLYWSKLLVKLNQIIFPDISLDSLSTSNYTITLRGKADSRDNLILFKKKLEDEACFSNINLPLSNLVNKKNIEFQISFEIKKDCLKNK